MASHQGDVELMQCYGPSFFDDIAMEIEAVKKQAELKGSMELESGLFFLIYWHDADAILGTKRPVLVS